MAGWAQDLRFGVRLVWRDRTFAAAVLLTLAFAVGANIAVLTVVRSVLFRPLPYPDPGRLVFAYEAFPGAGVERAGTSVPNYLDRLAFTDVFESSALFRSRGLDVGERGTAERILAQEVTPSFFDVLDVRPSLGRAFMPEEGQAGREHVVILAHDYWQRAFAGAATAVGRTLRINGEPYTIVGVMPPGFSFLDPDARLWIPVVFRAEDKAEDARYSQNHDQISRLRPGVPVSRAQEVLDRQTERNIEKAASFRSLLENAGYHSVAVSLADDVVREVRRTLHLLWGGAAFVLLIAVVNVTNLVLVRASGRLRELATRHALGAGHVRLSRQLLTETLLLSVAGSALGLGLGAAGVRWLVTSGLTDFPRSHEIALDWTVVAATIGAALLLGLVIGAAPVVHLRAMRLGTAIRDDSRGGTAGRTGRALRRVLVTVQVALAVMLLVGAGLLFASFRAVLGVDPGFRPAHVLSARVNPPASRYKDDAALTAFTARVVERVRTLPGVEAAGASSNLPFSGNSSSSVIVPEGYVPSPGESVVSPDLVRITPGLFEALGVALRSGRLFTASDDASAPKVVILDERLARRFWPKGDAVGRRMYFPSRPDDLVKAGPDVTWMQVVGVVDSVKLHGLIEGEEARVGACYLPYAQNPARNVGLAVRTSMDPAATTAAIRGAVAGIDPELPVFDVLPMPERVERSLDRRRTPMLLAVAFGGVALLLASVGIYGVLAYQVSQRSREFGIRLALGSDGAGILRLVLREGALLVGVGVVSGLAGAVLMRGAIASQLFAVSALDPRVVGAAVAVLSAAALAACLGPARRASRVDPVEVLNR